MLKSKTLNKEQNFLFQTVCFKTDDKLCIRYGIFATTYISIWFLYVEKL